MIILALDTTSEFGSIALHRDGRAIAELSLHAPAGFSRVLFDAVTDLKNKAEFALEECDCFAAAAGPGSFTGVRVGLSAVKGLAEAMRKQVCGVSNLRALSSFGKIAGLRAVAFDARRGDVYAAIYDHHLQLVSPETVCRFTDWLAQLDRAAAYEFIFPENSPWIRELAQSPFRDMPVHHAPLSLAAAVALCAEQDGKAGRWLDPAALDANYVRRSDAELFWKDG